jgi:hypothetical protein
MYLKLRNRAESYELKRGCEKKKRLCLEKKYTERYLPEWFPII